MMESDEFCSDCGDVLFEDGEYCLECDEGPFCSSCMSFHEDEAHSPHCYGCGVKLEIDPPCPVCHHEFCECCISTHVEQCQQKEDIRLGVQPTLYHFMFQDGVI